MTYAVNDGLEVHAQNHTRVAHARGKVGNNFKKHLTMQIKDEKQPFDESTRIVVEDIPCGYENEKIDEVSIKTPSFESQISTFVHPFAPRSHEVGVFLAPPNWLQ